MKCNINLQEKELCFKIYEPEVILFLKRSEENFIYFIFNNYYYYYLL